MKIALLMLAVCSNTCLGSTWTITVSGVLTIAPAGNLDGCGTVNGDVINDGTISPGDPLGEIEINGNYTQRSTGMLNIDLGGILQAQYDTLSVTGDTLLDGTLDVRLTNNFAPLVGDTFTIVSTSDGNHAGGFAVELLPNLPGGLAFDVVYNPQSVLLVVVEASNLLGDYNGNGAVDAADYVVWRNSSGQAGAGLAADGNNDGMVDQRDYQMWRNHFGQSVDRSPIASGAVPEPATTAFLVIVAVVWPLAKSTRDLHRLREHQ
jgi:hypothetical protein